LSEKSLNGAPPPAAFAEGAFAEASKSAVDGYIENRRYLREASGTHAVRTPLIFLHLLKRDAEPAGKIALGHSSDQPMRANGFSNPDVHGIWLSAFHCLPEQMHGHQEMA
jgi:hypothetical protein